MISLINRWIFGANTLPKKIDLPGYGIVDCLVCHKHLRNSFALSLITHLAKDHEMHENTAIDTATHMLDLLRVEKRKLRGQL